VRPIKDELEAEKPQQHLQGLRRHRDDAVGEMMFNVRRSVMRLVTAQRIW
jgi:hypothetical protein